jgi:hypothetical protein
MIALKIARAQGDCTILPENAQPGARVIAQLEV